MSDDRVIEIVRENVEFARMGTIRQADSVGRVPVSHSHIQLIVTADLGAG